jgi:hypothetical protein
MKIAEFKIVLNVRYGGFSLTKEMADWLAKNKGWKITEKNHLDTENDLCGLYGEYYPTNKYGEDEIRRNPDLIECVRAVQKAHVKDSWSDQHYDKNFALRIFDVTVNLDIEDVHDGKEEAQVGATVEPERWLWDEEEED